MNVLDVDMHEEGVAKRGRGWFDWLGEVVHAVRRDPVLLAPVGLVVALAMLLAYLGWRFL